MKMTLMLRTVILVLMACACHGLAMADTASQYRFDVPAQPVTEALKAFAERTRLQVVYYSEGIEGASSPGAVGRLTAEEALKKLLDGTGLSYRFLNDRTIAIGSAADVAKGKAVSPGMAPQAAAAAAQELRIARVQDSEQQAAASAPTGAAQEGETEIVVTGSSIINDPNKLTRQMTVFTREEIEKSGATRLDEFLNRLPQNVNAPNNVGAGNYINGANFGVGRNVFAGSTVNLRGLGSQYTLVLIDGRRPAKGGQFGDVADISNFPLSRIARIEVLYDGAAAIYGADAIGGVVNIITNRDYEGASVDVSYDVTEDGGGNRVDVNVANTYRWRGGSLTASVGYQGQKGIDGAERDIDFINTLPVPPGVPGNLGFGLDSVVRTPLFYTKDLNGDGQTTSQTGIDPAFAAAMNAYFGPSAAASFSGERIHVGNTALNPLFSSFELYDVFAGFFGFPAAPNPEDYGYTPVYSVGVPSAGLTRNPGLYEFQDGFAMNEMPLQRGYSLAPKDDTYSLSFAADHELSGRLRLSGTVAYSQTKKSVGTSNGVQIVNIASPDPVAQGFPVQNPFGVYAAYAVYTDLPLTVQAIDQFGLNAAGTLAWDLTDRWTLTLGAGFGISSNEAISHNQVSNSAYQDVANGGRREFIDGSLQIVPVDPGLNIFAPDLGYPTREAYMEAALLPDAYTRSKTRSLDTDVRLQGPLFALPAGDALGGFSIGYRENNSHIANNNTGSGLTTMPEQVAGMYLSSVYDRRYDDRTASAGAEFTLPLVSSAMAVPLVQNFLVNLQARTEDYSETAFNGHNWSAGFNWQLTDWFITRLNRNYSVRVAETIRTAAPATLTNSFIGYYDASRTTTLGFRPVRILNGGADPQAVKPESDYGTSLSFIFRPTFARNLDIKLSLYQNDTRDQIGQPALDPRYTLAELTDPALIAQNPLFSTDASGLIIDGREYNVGRTHNRGADLELNYLFDSRVGSWYATLRHNYVDRFIVDTPAFCRNGACIGNTNTDADGNDMGQSFDIVGTVDEQAQALQRHIPLPRNRSSLILGWSRNGFDVGLDTTFTSTTSIISAPSVTLFDPENFVPLTVTSVIERTTIPSRSVNMRLGYDFSEGAIPTPRWLRTARVSLTVTSLYSREQKIEDRILSSDLEGLVDFQQLSNLVNINPRGRTFTLGLSATF